MVLTVFLHLEQNLKLILVKFWTMIIENTLKYNQKEKSVILPFFSYGGTESLSENRDLCYKNHQHLE